MSYILDALKKAERERRIAQVPTLTTVHDVRSTERTRLAALAGAFLLCVAAVLWFFVPAVSTIFRSAEPASSAQHDALANLREEKPIEAASTNPGQSAFLPPHVPPAPKPEPNDSHLPADDATAVVPLPTAPKAVIVRQDAAAQRAVETTGRVTPLPQGAPAVQQTRPEAVSPTLPEAIPSPPGASPAQKVHVELSPATAGTQAKPQSLKEAVSKMTLSLVVYADVEADRKVYINGKKYAKGDYVDDRYLIESINADGVVLSYEGARAILRP